MQPSAPPAPDGIIHVSPQHVGFVVDGTGYNQGPPVGYNQAPMGQNQGPQVGYNQGPGGYPNAGPGLYQGQAPMAHPGQQPGQTAAGNPWQPTAPPEGAGPSYQGDDVPDTDPEDNDDDDEPVKSLPPPDLASLATPPGYEQSAASGMLMPPPAYTVPDEATAPLQTFTGVGTLNEQQVRDAICAYADQQCCYGTGAAQGMTFKKMEASGGLHYQLETFTETRTTSWQHLPHRGGQVDGPHCGPAPGPWDIRCLPLTEFNTHEQRLEVPHTSNIKKCHNCTGCGFVRCPKCQGRGKVRCSSCHGSGRKTTHRDGHSHTSNCSWCHGSGRRRCPRCGGDGRITCPVCEGFTDLRWFIELKVQFTNNVEDFIHETTDMPDNLIRNVSGMTVFEQTLPYVWPICQYSVPAINENSIRIVERHRGAWPNAKTLKQRQILRSVPVTEVEYTHKDHKDRFWVYGNEHEVHCPDYPQTCCWGCTIL